MLTNMSRPGYSNCYYPNTQPFFPGIIPTIDYQANQALLATLSANALRNAMIQQYSLLCTQQAMNLSKLSKFQGGNPFMNSDAGKNDFQQTSANSKEELFAGKKSSESVTVEEVGIEAEEERKFKCKHAGCGLAFKTKRQSIMHHNKFEAECKSDRNTIVRVIGKFKLALRSLIKKYGVDKEKLENSEKYLELIRKFNKIKSELIDPEYFAFVVGEKVLDDEM